jgi:hypothetical protein
MFTLYTVLLTLHISVVVAWVGAGMTVHVITRQSVDNPAWPGILVRFSEKWFPAVSGLAALTGILLWIDGPWGFGDLWILLAVAGWIASAAIGATQLSPRAARWAGGDQAVRAEFLTLVQVDQALLFLIIADMVLKPGL